MNINDILYLIMVVIVSIQGNIGSGKSTFVEKMKLHHLTDKKVCFLQEPVDQWNDIRDSSGKTMIEKYYKNQNKYAFSFQMMAYISRLSILEDALDKDYDYIITERSLLTDCNVFAKMLYDDDKIEDVEYQIYKKWFSHFIKKFPIEKQVYIKTTPKISHQRVLKRSRKGEEIELSYLVKCNNYHDTWLNSLSKKECLTLNGNIDTTNNEEQYTEWFKQIYLFIK